MAKKTKKIVVDTCQYVRASDLFQGNQKLWDIFVESDPDYSWGNNNHSLNTAESIVNHLDGNIGAPEKLVKKLRDRIDSLPEKGQTYVDLEN